MMSPEAIGPRCPQIEVPGAFGGKARLRELDQADFSRVRALNDTVIGLLPDPEAAVLETDEFLRAHLGAAGATVGVELGDDLIACAVLGLPTADDPYNFGFDIGADAATRAAVAHLDGCLVLPPWRGHGLQRRLALWRIARAESMGRSVILSVASPRNPVSLRNLIGAGLSIVGLKPKFGGQLRFVLARGRQAGPPGTGRPGAAERRAVASGDARETPVLLSDTEGHLARLAAGDLGVGFDDRGPEPSILYRRPEAGA